MATRRAGEVYGEGLCIHSCAVGGCRGVRVALAQVQPSYPTDTCLKPRVVSVRRAGTARRRRGCCAARAARRCGCGWCGAAGASRGCPRGPSRGPRRGRWSTRSCRCGGRGCSSARSSTQRCLRRSCRRVRPLRVTAQGRGRGGCSQCGWTMFRFGPISTPIAGPPQPHRSPSWTHALSYPRPKPPSVPVTFLWCTHPDTRDQACY